MIVLKNERISAKINERGAELKSLRRDEVEYIWEGKPEIWNFSAPLLFPICGGLKDDCFTPGGMTYRLPQHGYARMTDFEVESATDTCAVFLHRSDEETKKSFPFDYELRVRYSLEGDALLIDYLVRNTGEETIQLVTIPQTALEQLKATVKIDITPKSVYDRFAQEQTVENLLIQGLFNAQRVSELRAYAASLDDDSVAPKVKILEIVEKIEAEQRKIAEINARAQMMQQRAQQFLMGDPDDQAQQISDARMQMQLEKDLAEKEAQYAEKEAGLDEETAEAEAKTDKE